MPLQQPQPSPPPPAAASQQNTVRLDIEVPEGANVGDRLTFNTAAGQFSLVVPWGAAPGKKMMVTMPVPANFATSQPLQVARMAALLRSDPARFVDVPPLTNSCSLDVRTGRWKEMEAAANERPPRPTHDIQE